MALRVARDSALAASALARTGHASDAERIGLPAAGATGVGIVPGPPADGSGVPDARGVELDGVGWALWATGQVAAELPGRS